MVTATVAALAATASVLCLGVAVARSADPSDRRPPGAFARWQGSQATWVTTIVAASLGAVAGMSLGGVPAAVILGAAGAIVPAVLARRGRARRSALLEEQLLELVSSLAAAVRSGRSLEQALVVAAERLEAPLGASVAAIGDRVALGVPLEDAVGRWAEDLGSPETRLVAGVLRMHRRAGGGLARPLEELAETLRARRAGARELRSLTAQARLSAAILGLLPVGFFLFLSVVSRRDIEAAIATPAGLGAIGVGAALQGAAFVWIRSLLRVEA
jgi:tight adherence protein B